MGHIVDTPPMRRKNFSREEIDKIFYYKSLNYTWKTIGEILFASPAAVENAFRRVNKSAGMPPKGILSLSWCRDRPFDLLRALSEDIDSGKKPFKVLFRPLILYMDKLYNELDESQRQKFTNYLTRRNEASFKYFLAKTCATNGHFDLSFEFLKNEPIELSECISRIKNRKAIIEWFRKNPERAIEFQTMLSNNLELEQVNDIHYAKTWVAECIINNLPLTYYRELLALRPIIYKRLEGYLCLSMHVSESEYSRIHMQYRNIINEFLEPRVNRAEYSYQNLINDIRFGPNQNQRSQVSDYNDEQVIAIAEAALLAGKEETFIEVQERFVGDQKNYLLDRMMTKYSENGHEYPSKFKVICEIIAANPQIVDRKNRMKFLMNFYAIKHFSVEANSPVYTLEFVALKEKLDLGFPERIIVTNRNLAFCIFDLFYFMKEVDEDSLSSFMTDFGEYSRVGTLYSSFELIKFIDRTPSVLEMLKQHELKLTMSPLKLYLYIPKFLDLPNYKATAQILDMSRVKYTDLFFLKTKNLLRKFEETSGKTVADYFLAEEKKNGQVTNEFEYFKWRLIFNYWIKGDQRERIKEITSTKIIKMLRLEFRDAMNEILGPEKKD